MNTMMQQAQSEAGEPMVPAGYKQTEVGVIPEDWETYPLAEILRSTQLGGNYANSEYESAYPLIKMGNLGRGEINLDKVEYVSTFPRERDKLNYGDVLFNTRNTLELVGKVSIWRNELKSAYFNSNLMRLEFDECYVSNNFFINAAMNTKQFISALSGIATGTTSVAAIYTRDLLSLNLPLPPKKEQTAIANALSDMDALIGSLEALIAKKQAIKTATMQQLLTGHTRLPQFATHPDGSPKGYKASELGEIPEDWEVVPFGSFFDSQSTQRKKLAEDEEVSFVGMQDVSESAKLIQSQQLAYSEIKSGLTYFERGDVLVAKITPCFENGKGCHTEELKTEVGFGSTEFHVLKANQDADSWFIYFWTIQADFRMKLESEMVGSAGHRRVPLSAIMAFTIQAPSSREEQTAIASILSDMDEEIQALEARLTKTRDLKQGMMQQLLTGKIRLIQPLAGDEHHAG